jgi:hypothetical protein
MDEQTGKRVERPDRLSTYRRAAVVLAITIVLGGLFVASYTLALARPRPHHIPAALVGSSAQAPLLVKGLEQATGGALSLRPYPSVQAAEAAIGRMDVYAALVLDPREPRLLVASAAGTSVSRLLEQAAQQVSRVARPPLTVVDVRPLPPSDPLGLTSFYATLGATILGFLTAFQLRANAPGLSLRAWLVCIAVLAVVGGLVLATIVARVLSALPAPVPGLWAALAAETAISSLFASTMLVLTPRWAFIPTWLVFVVLGNTSSGGPVAPPLLPPFYAFVGRFLPPGATVNILHTVVYFPEESNVLPVVVQACWLVATLAALVGATRILRRGPSQ